MATTKMQKQDEGLQSNLQQTPQHSENRHNGEALEKLGGFAAVKGFIPSIDTMNPSKQAIKSMFLTESKYKDKRDELAKELRCWIEILSNDKNDVREYKKICEEQEEKDHKLLEKNVTKALEATKQLETSYRVLDSFYQNANADKLKNLRLINVSRNEIVSDDNELSKSVDQLLKDGFDRLSLKNSYSLVVIPGAGRDMGNGSLTDMIQEKNGKDTILKWAKIAYKYKAMLILDHNNEHSFDELYEHTSEYKDSDKELQNVIMTGNWLVGRPKESLSTTEQNDSENKAFYIPASGAIAGKLYNESANMAQGAAGKKYGTLDNAKGVNIDLLRSEIDALRDNQIIPITYSEGRVMAFNNKTLYNGDDPAKTEYPIVRVFDWIKKVLMNFVAEVSGENWDPYKSPTILKNIISSFLNQYQGYGNLFKSYSLKEPIQGADKKISIDIDIVPFYAANSFVIKLSADEKERSCEEA